MAVRCGDLVNLPSLRQIRLVAGADGLDRNIRWVYTAEVLEDALQVAHWLNGGELLFLTGIGLRENAGRLTELIRSVAAKNIAGIVIFIGPYIQNIDDQSLQLANQLKMPLFELPWEVKLVEVSHEICSAIIMKEMEEQSLQNLLENILFSKFESPDSFVKITALHGYDLAVPQRVLIADLDDFEAFLKDKGGKDEYAVLRLKSEFQKVVRRALSKNNQQALAMPRSDSIIMLVPGGENDDRNIKKLVDDIRKNVTEQLYGLTVSVGIGNCYQDLKDMKQSLHEAEQALRVAKLNERKNSTCFFKKLGVYRLLLNCNDRKGLESIFQEMLGELLQYDRHNGTNLVKTLAIFLEEKGSLIVTAGRLFIHRNTLTYRLQKIEEVSGFKINNAEDCFNLQLALKIGKLLGQID